MTTTIYPKIRDLEKCPEIFSVKNVIITEKIHGKNMRIIIPANTTEVNQIIFGGREITEKDALYGLGSETLFLRQHLPLGRILDRFKGERVDYIIYGEIYGAGIQKGMNYGSSKAFCVFDIAMGEFLLPFDETKKICEEIGLPLVPIVFEGEPSKEIFKKLINVESWLAKEKGADGTITEGIVIKSTTALRNTFGDYLMCKYKSDGFEEKISTKEEKPKIDASPLSSFASTYVVEVRIRKMIDKLKEKGGYTGTMADAKPLGDELSKDIETEEKDEFEKILKENPHLNKKMLFAEIMKVALPILKKVHAE